MITRLCGRLVDDEITTVVVDVQGVGYEVSVPMSTHERLPPLGENLTLHTHLQTREDGSYLFGFATKRERQLFRLLITVSGIGPRLALNVLSCLSVNEFAQAILIGDLKGLSRVSGIGKRSAERLVVELKERIQELDLGGEDLGAARSPSLSPEARDAVAALQTLGFKPETARKAVEKISADTAHSTEDYIVAALRDLNS